jgi:hypothetical protein
MRARQCAKNALAERCLYFKNEISQNLFVCHIYKHYMTEARAGQRAKDARANIRCVAEMNIQKTCVRYKHYMSEARARQRAKDALADRCLYFKIKNSEKYFCVSHISIT